MDKNAKKADEYRQYVGGQDRAVHSVEHIQHMHDNLHQPQQNIHDRMAHTHPHIETTGYDHMNVGERPHVTAPDMAHRHQKHDYSRFERDIRYNVVSDPHPERNLDLDFIEKNNIVLA